MRKWLLLALVLLAPSAAHAQVAHQPGAVIVSSPYRIFTGSPGWVGIGPGASNPWGSAYPTVRLDVTGDSDTRVRIDGANTSGIFFTLGGQDGPTIRYTVQGLEVWANGHTGPVLRVEGTTIHILGNLQVDGNANVTGNIGAKLQ
jgi:hypothetical protein